MKSDERGLCGRCEKEYEPYKILLCDDIECFKGWYMAKQEYGWICPDCLSEYYDKTNKPKSYAVD